MTGHVRRTSSVTSEDMQKLKESMLVSHHQSDERGFETVMEKFLAKLNKREEGVEKALSGSTFLSRDFKVSAAY